MEARIEEQVAARDCAGRGESAGCAPLAGALDDYLRELQSQFQLDLDGRRVLLDCANGATYRAAPLLFERLGAQVEVIAASPTASTSTPVAARRTWVRWWSECAKAATTIGFAFDGDGDRVLAVDRDGRVVDGDEIIAQIAALT